MNPLVQCVNLTGRHEDHDRRPQVLMWDGRLDNRQSLLLQLGSLLAGETSNEALVQAAYEKWGVPGLRHLIGDWSAVLHDVSKDTVILASDFMGVRPLYYHKTQTAAVLWSSRLKALVQATGVGTLDETYAAGFLTLGGYPNHTPYAGIQSVPPGCAVLMTTRATTVQAFWKPPVGDPVRFRDEGEYEEELRWHFSDAVAARLQSGGPVLAELSGGLDSSSVVCMASQLMRSGSVPSRQLTTVSYDYAESLDSSFIRELEEFCGVNGVHFSTDVHPVLSATEVGEASPACWVPLQASVKALAEKVNAKTFLTGLNGDLAMGNWLDDSLQIAGSIRAGHVGKALSDALAWSKALRTPVAWILWQGMKAALPSMLTPSTIYDPESAMTSADSLVPTFAAAAGVARPSDVFSADWRHARPERRKHVYSLTMTRELRVLQTPETFEGLDFTHPFAHRPLVEFAMTIPADVLCGPGSPRRLMRRAFRDLWPAKLRTRRSKSYFTAPWVEALRPLAQLLMKAPRWHVVEHGWVDRVSLAGRLNRLLHRLDCNEAQLRQIIVLEFWLRQRDRSLPGEWIRKIA